MIYKYKEQSMSCSSHTNTRCSQWGMNLYQLYGCQRDVADNTMWTLTVTSCSGWGYGLANLPATQNDDAIILQDSK